jgi:hypothetical protein
MLERRLWKDTTRGEPWQDQGIEKGKHFRGLAIAIDIVTISHIMQHQRMWKTLLIRTVEADGN